MYYDRCTEFACDDSEGGRILKCRPILVAASVGSYGAYLADGSEYRWGDNTVFFRRLHVFYTHFAVSSIYLAGVQFICCHFIPSAF